LDSIITAEEIKNKPHKYIVKLDFYSFTELIDIQPEPESHFIYSMSEPFTEEDLEEEVLHNWLNHFRLKYHQLHASGHMSRGELEEAINRVKPRKLFPIHSEEGEKFKQIYDKVVIQEIGKEYKLT
jgi:ribonuclease J